MFLRMGTTVAVAGASGYAGGELLRLLAGHPELDVGPATAHASAGERLGSVHPHLVSLADRVLGADRAGHPGRRRPGLPRPAARASPPRSPRSCRRDVQVVDLGADHRLRRRRPPGRATTAATHAGTWTYGLPELPGQRAAIAAVDRVAATGCYAVATILALAPLIAAGLVEPDDVVVVAASGTSGAGRAAKAHLLGSEVMGDLSPYKVGAPPAHAGDQAGDRRRLGLSFTPVLAPMPRGILATVHRAAGRPA